MRIERVIIPAHVLNKLHWKHRVSEEEVHELLHGHPKVYFVEKGNVVGEDVYLVLGQTQSGRYLGVFFIYKKNKNALVLSARDMKKKERRRYEKKR
jgi:uncharacterized DUF497 family protein